VLFLDEFDAIAKMRDDNKELGELKRVVISLMQNIDAMGRDHVLLAATNHEHLLDPAIWRRFANRLELKEPTLDSRREMLAHFFHGFANDETIKLAAALSDGANGAALRDIAEDAIRSAVISGQQSVNEIDVIERIAGASSVPDLVDAVKRADPGITQKRLADLFGMSQSGISQLLKRRRERAA
jgi:SpoVK/Ycf46/Vps4 family AAA+-type ATPase